MINHIKWAYFGGEPLGKPVLQILKERGLTPDLIVCNPDKKSGRKLVLTPPKVKEFAIENNIPVFQPESLKEKEELKLLTEKSWDLFVVVAYNHYLPQWLFSLPKYKTINLHPSLLPKLRGPSPIRTAILDNRKEDIGVTIIELSGTLDSGDILAKEPITIDENEWPIGGAELDNLLAVSGGKLLADTIPRWTAGAITPLKQNESEASYTEKFTKEMGLVEFDPLNLPTNEVAKDLLLKIRAYEDFPGTFFIKNGKRVKLLSAEIEDHTLKPLRVIPEAKKEMSFEEYLSTLKTE